MISPPTSRRIKVDAQGYFVICACRDAGMTSHLKTHSHTYPHARAYYCRRMRPAHFPQTHNVTRGVCLAENTAVPLREQHASLQSYTTLQGH